MVKPKTDTSTLPAQSMENGHLWRCSHPDAGSAKPQVVKFSILPMIWPHFYPLPIPWYSPNDLRALNRLKLNFNFLNDSLRFHEFHWKIQALKLLSSKILKGVGGVKSLSSSM
jgi:hypothetical protein